MDTNTAFGYFTAADLLFFIATMIALVFGAGIVYGFLSWLAVIGRYATSKVCPACRERVKADATKCKHCHERLA